MNHAGVGVLESHQNMAATLLVSRPEHNAATPTWKRQGSLVTADALPVVVELLRPESWLTMTLGKHSHLLPKRKSPDASRADFVF